MKRLLAGALAAAGLLAAGCYEGRDPNAENPSWVAPDPSLRPQQNRAAPGTGGAGEPDSITPGPDSHQGALFDSNTVGSGEPYETTSSTPQPEVDDRGDEGRGIGETKQD